MAVANFTLERSPVTVTIPLSALGWMKPSTVTETTDDADLSELFESIRRSKQSDRLAELERITAEAAANRKPPGLSVVDGTLRLTLEVESHEHRVFVIQGQ